MIIFNKQTIKALQQSNQTLYILIIFLQFTSQSASAILNTQFKQKFKNLLIFNKKSSSIKRQEKFKI